MAESKTDRGAGYSEQMSRAASLTPYRASEGSEATLTEISRLRRRIEALERVFEGILPFQTDRTFCPICNLRLGYGEAIRNVMVRPKRTWLLFGRMVPGHVKRTHTPGCNATWREMISPDVVPVVGGKDWL